MRLLREIYRAAEHYSGAILIAALFGWALLGDR